MDREELNVTREATVKESEETSRWETRNLKVKVAAVYLFSRRYRLSGWGVVMHQLTHMAIQLFQLRIIVLFC